MKKYRTTWINSHFSLVTIEKHSKQSKTSKKNSNVSKQQKRKRSPQNEQKWIARS